MYKEYNEKHDAIVNFYYSSKAINPIEGEIVPHGKIVRDVHIYQSTFINGREVFNKVYLSKEFLIDLAKQITEIESQEKDLTYSNIPF